MLGNIGLFYVYMDVGSCFTCWTLVLYIVLIAPYGTMSPLFIELSVVSLVCQPLEAGALVAKALQ